MTRQQPDAPSTNPGVPSVSSAWSGVRLRVADDTPGGPLPTFCHTQYPRRRRFDGSNHPSFAIRDQCASTITHRGPHTSSGSSILTRPSAGRSCVTSPMKTPTRLRPSGPASQRKVRGPNSSPSNLRAAFGIPEPSEHLSEAISFIRQAIRAATSTCDQPTIDVLLNSCRKDRLGQYRLEALVRRVLRSTLEQLRSRQAK